MLLLMLLKTGYDTKVSKIEKNILLHLVIIKWNTFARIKENKPVNKSDISKFIDSSDLNYKTTKLTKEQI